MLEYMAAGSPVVATNVGGAAEAIIDGETGYLVPTDDDEAMADGLLDLLEDPDKAKQFGSQANKSWRRNSRSEAQLKNDRTVQVCPKSP